MDPVATIRVSVVVATDGHVGKYGGISLAPEALHSMAEALNSGGIPMTWNHDPRQPVKAKNVTARVEELESGRLAVVAEFDVEADAWAEIESHFADAGVPGGFSFTASTPISVIGPETADRITLAAEADHFDEADVVAAAELLAMETSVHAQTLFQFSAVQEVARIIIEMGAGVIVVLGPEIIGAALYDAVKLLLGRKRQPGRTMVDFRVEEGNGVRRTQAIVVTDDPEVAGTAIRECYRQISDLRGIVEYDPLTGTWVQRDE